MKRHYIQSLATLQLMAIFAIVASHFWLDGATYLQAFCVSFCFLYSGFFTASSHDVKSGYGLRAHACYMRDKLAKLYPLHVLALLLCALAAYLLWGTNLLFSKVMVAQLAMVHSWIPLQGYYFGINPVSWFLCDLFFLYLISPLIIRLLRRLSLGWQMIVVVAFIGLEMLVGYADDPASPSLLIPAPAHYYLYEFPVVRILDFTTGIVLYHVTQGSWWRGAVSRLTASRATLVEAGAVVAFLVFYRLGETLLHPHWYRAFCSVAPAAVTLLAAFIFTSGKGGAISRILSQRQWAALCAIGAEVYLLQLGSFAVMGYMVKSVRLPSHGIVYYVIQSVALLLLSLMVHYCFVLPLYRRLRSRKNTAEPKNA